MDQRVNRLRARFSRPSQPASGRERLLTAAICGLLLAGLALWLPGVVSAPIQLDFTSYYLAATALNRGLSPYDQDVLRALATIEQLPEPVAYLYPPWFAAVLRPLALLDYPTAAAIWPAANLLSCLLAAALLCNAVGLPRHGHLAAATVLLLWPALQQTLELGQVNALLLLLISAGLRALRDGRDRFSGGWCFGLAAAVKLFPLILVVPLVFGGYRRATAGTAAALALTTLVGLLLGGGPETSRVWLTEVLPRHSAGVHAVFNQSLQSSAARLAQPITYQSVLAEGPRVIPPLIAAPQLFTALGWLAAGAVLTVTVHQLWHSRRLLRRQLTSAAALVITTSLLVTPVVWYHYYLLLLLPLAVLQQQSPCGSSRRLLLLLGVLLIVMQRFWRLTAELDMPLLLAFGTLGTLLIWLLLLRPVAHADPHHAIS